jgi:hypothetical protein
MNQCTNLIPKKQRVEELVSQSDQSIREIKSRIVFAILEKIPCSSIDKFVRQIASK